MSCGGRGRGRCHHDHSPPRRPTVAIPFVGEIPGGIKEDIAVVFQGTVPADANKFSINLKTGPSDGDDIAFHYNPRISDYTAINSFRNGDWEKEEKASNKPFTKGGDFIIIVVINSEGYEVYVNGFRHCTFKHRIPLEKVSTLNVCGNVSLLVCGFIDSWSTTSSFTELKKITSTQSSTSTLTSLPLEISHPINNPAIPYVGTIPRVKKHDLAVLFQGIVHQNAERFEINFQTGQGTSDDIAFHFNPRIGHYTALNSLRNGSWEEEVSAHVKPFTNGAAFQIIVVFKSDGYEVYVNGLSHCTFKHRIPLEKVSTIAIHGKVTIDVIGFIDNWKSSSI